MHNILPKTDAGQNIVVNLNFCASGNWIHNCLMINLARVMVQCEAVASDQFDAKESCTGRGQIDIYWRADARSSSWFWILF